MTQVKSKTGKVVHAATFEPVGELPEWTRSDFPDGWLLTACTLTFQPRYEVAAEVTCAICRKTAAFQAS
jgi:hypothetical protein